MVFVEQGKQINPGSLPNNYQCSNMPGDNLPSSESLEKDSELDELKPWKSQQLLSTTPLYNLLLRQGLRLSKC